MFRSAVTALSRAPARMALQHQQRQFAGLTPTNSASGAGRMNQQFQQTIKRANSTTATADFSTQAPKTNAEAGRRACQSELDGKATGSIWKRFFPLMVFNPVTAVVGYFLYYRFDQKEFTIEDERNAINMNKGQVEAIRDARRSSIRDYKMHVWGKDDKEDYDEASYRRYNHTAIVKTNSFRPGGQEAEANKFGKKKSNRIGLYDSEGRLDATRTEGSGIDAYKERMAAQNAQGAQSGGDHIGTTIVR